jgi:hypothetical protein
VPGAVDDIGIVDNVDELKIGFMILGELKVAKINLSGPLQRPFNRVNQYRFVILFMILL